MSAWCPPTCGGIAVVLARSPQWGPKPLQPLYFGEFGNDADCRLNLPSNAGRDLLVAALPMPYTTASQRRALCNELIAAHNPAWQSHGIIGSEAVLRRKVEDLEARQQEQGREILSLLTYLGKIFEPQTLGPRKPIGFLSELAPPVTESGS